LIVRLQLETPLLSKFLRFVFILVLVIEAAGCSGWRLPAKIPEYPFTPLSGPYAVGTREYSWIDPTRDEPYTKTPNDRRRLVVQVWYPIERSARGDPAPYLLRPDEFADRGGARAVRHVKTRSLLDAPLATGSLFPVLVYNHGGGWTRWSSTFSTEWLASHGYVIFSIEHFGFNQTIRYPDGTPFTPDALSMPTPTGDVKQDALASWAFLDDPVFGIWKADTKFALDQIEVLNRNGGPFAGRLDLERIGIYGWSFGGAVAVQMTADDPRIKAAMNHDGQLFGDVRQRGTSRPVMQIDHGVDDALMHPEKDRPLVREMSALVAGWDSTARSRSTADWYKIVITGTDHADFSDLALFYPRDAGRIDPKRGHEIINAYTLAFFDRYLRGTSSALLAGPARAFPEASFQSWLQTPRAQGGTSE
jgi:predicted dienelactone hydrolase